MDRLHHSNHSGMDDVTKEIMTGADAVMTAIKKTVGK